MEISANQTQVKVHFDGWLQEWDEWIDINSNKLAQFNSVINDNNNNNNNNNNTVANNNNDNNNNNNNSIANDLRTVNPENAQPIDTSQILNVGARVDARDFGGMLCIFFFLLFFFVLVVIL